MKFSYCVIAKDEELTLPRLVASLKDFQKAGGVCCLLDTGSTDATVQIARDAGWIVEEAGDKFLHVIDKDFAAKINEQFIVAGEDPCVKEGDTYFDFASARNACADLSPTDMVSMADADEIMTTLNYEHINTLIEHGAVQFKYNFVFSHKEDGSAGIEFEQSKFYDRRKMKWVGIVHEYLHGETVQTFLPNEVFRLEHFQIPHDRHSYLKGLAVDCFEHPDKDRNSHYFARELMYAGRPASAIKEFDRHTGLNGWLPEQMQSHIYIGDCYGVLNNEESQIANYFRAFEGDPSRRIGLLRLAWVAFAKKEWQKVICYAKAALEIPWNAAYMNNRADYEDVPHSLLYQAYGWLGNIPEAQKHILKALEYQPYNAKYLEDTKYYFSYKYPNIDGWMTFDELLYLYELGSSYENIVEVGSWKGRSTHALLSGGAYITAIDTWQGSDDENDLTNDLAKKEDIFEVFKKNVEGVGNLTAIKTTSEDAAQAFEEKSIDVVFIDALHTYEGVKKDIALWKDKAYFIICGHDWTDSWPGVKKAVRELLGEPHEVHGSIWVFYTNELNNENN